MPVADYRNTPSLASARNQSDLDSVAVARRHNWRPGLDQTVADKQAPEPCTEPVLPGPRQPEACTGPV